MPENKVCCHEVDVTELKDRQSQKKCEQLLS